MCGVSFSGGDEGAKQKFDRENERGRSLSMPEREPERAAFVAVKAANAMRNKAVVHRYSLQADGINGDPETLWGMVK